MSEQIDLRDAIADAAAGYKRRMQRDLRDLRTACQMLITAGSEISRLAERARGHLGDDVDPALLVWAQCVVAARGAIEGGE